MGFSEFLQIFMKLAGPKPNLHPRTEMSSMALLTPKLSIYCYFFKYFVLTDFFYFLFFFKVCFERKFIKYLMELTWAGSNHLKVFWKMNSLTS